MNDNNKDMEMMLNINILIVNTQTHHRLYNLLFIIELLYKMRITNNLPYSINRKLPSFKLCE